MHERLTEPARKIMLLAESEAIRLNHEYVGTEHILLGLAKEGTGVAEKVLKVLGVEPLLVAKEVERYVLLGPTPVKLTGLPQTPRAKNVLRYAIQEARSLNHRHVGSEQILLGILREQEGFAGVLLSSLGLKLEDVRDTILKLLGQSPGRESG